MKLMKALVPILSGLLAITAPLVAQAAVPITVTIDGVTCASCTGNDSVSIPNGTYGRVTISGLTAGTTATVLSVADDTQDRLELRNAKINATVKNETIPIVFEGVFSAPPTGGPWYYRARGTSINRFDKGATAALNSWVQFKGSFSQGGNWYQLGDTVLIPPAGLTVNNLNFNKIFTPTHTVSTEFSGITTDSRTLKGELLFKVADLSHTLKIQNTQDALSIHSSAQPGPGDPPPCQAPGEICGIPVTLPPPCVPINKVGTMQAIMCALFGNCGEDVCWILKPWPKREPLAGKMKK